VETSIFAFAGDFADEGVETVLEPRRGGLGA
jgi:hypothetical protein